MNILFLCVANSARSQMAEGLAKQIFGRDFNIESAGSQPSGTVNPFAIQAMKKYGIDITTHHSKSWDDLPRDFFDNLDFVITLCAEEICPTVPSKAQRLHWGLPDPAYMGKSDEERLLAFENTRDEIEKRLKHWRQTLYS